MRCKRPGPRRAPATGIAGLLLLLAAPLAAQGGGPACFGPHPAPQCGSWVITEAGARYRLTDRYEDEQNVFFHYAAGWMKNIGARTALGVQAFGGSDGHARGGVAVRARRWLSMRSSVDLVVGAHLLGDASAQEVKPGSPTFQLRVAHRDLVALVGSVDILALRCPEFCDFVRDPNTTRTRTFLGAEIGSGAGVVGMAITAAGFVVAAIIYDGGG